MILCQSSNHSWWSLFVVFRRYIVKGVPGSPLAPSMLITNPFKSLMMKKYFVGLSIRTQPASVITASVAIKIIEQFTSPVRTVGAVKRKLSVLNMVDEARLSSCKTTLQIEVCDEVFT